MLGGFAPPSVGTSRSSKAGIAALSEKGRWPSELPGSSGADSEAADGAEDRPPELLRTPIWD